jgi:hypothetical protein
MEKLQAPQSETERVTLYREEVLYHAGYPLELAEQLAKNDYVNLHLAVQLVEQGCDPKLAERILT